MSRRIARPYAAALFTVVAKSEPGLLREVQLELQRVEQLFASEPRLLRVFEVPGVSAATKKGILKEVAQALGLRKPTARLLAALAQHYRLRFLPDVAAMFGEMLDRREGIVRGLVDVPAALDASQLDALRLALHALVGGKVELESRTRPELLAGFVVRLGSRVFDGSLRTQLARFAATAGRE